MAGTQGREEEGRAIGLQIQCFVVLLQLILLEMEWLFFRGNLVTPEKRAIFLKNRKFCFFWDRSCLFLWLPLTSRLPQSLLAFGFPLLENVWDLLFPSISGWLLRATDSQARATDSAPNHVTNSFPRGQRRGGAVGFRVSLLNSLFMDMELKQNTSYCPWCHLSPKKETFFFFFKWSVFSRPSAN